MNKEKTEPIFEFDLKLIASFFRGLDQQGPGSDEQTLRALEFIDTTRTGLRIADIGCGTGRQTEVLARHLDGQITAIDLLPELIEGLEERIRRARYVDKVTPVVGSMDDLPFEDGSLDIIWAEGSIYNIGFEQGLTAWRQYLRPGGVIAVTECSWLTTARRPTPYMLENFPDIDTPSAKVRILENAGYLPLYLVEAGYNPQGLSGAFAKIQELSYGRGANFPEYLSTHPDLTARLATMSSRIQTMPAAVRQRRDDDTRFRRVQTLIWAQYGDPQHAAQVFAGRDAKDPMTHLGMGMLAARQNRVMDAETSFAQALKLAPRDSLILREAGIFHYNMGDIQVARTQLEQALKINPEDYMGLFFYARLLDDEGDSKAAQAAYRKVLRYVPEDAEVHTYYGRSLGKSRQEFQGYLHLAYAAVYSNDERKAKTWQDKAKSFSSTPEDRAEMEKFNELLKTRQKLWSQR